MGPLALSAIPANHLAVEDNDRATAPWRTISLCALAVIFLAVYFGSLFTPALLDDADSTHAEAGREMFVTGDYVTLHVNGFSTKICLPALASISTTSLRTCVGVHTTAISHSA